MEIEIFDFRQTDFQEKYNDYCDRVEKELILNDKYLATNSNERKSWCPPMENRHTADYLKLLQHQFPQFLKDFLNEFAKSRFFKKYYDEYKDYWTGSIGEVQFPYTAVNWYTSGTRHDSDKTALENIMRFAKFGEIPAYQHDKLHCITIDFETKTAVLERGYAVAPWASRVVSTKYPIPKYMKPIVYKLFDDYENFKN